MVDQRNKDSNTLLSQKFDDYQVALPPNDWEEFSRKLAKAQAFKRHRAVWYYAAAASIAGVLFMGYFLFLGQHNHISHNGIASVKQAVPANAATPQQPASTKTNQKGERHSAKSFRQPVKQQSVLIATSTASSREKEVGSKQQQPVAVAVVVPQHQGQHPDSANIVIAVSPVYSPNNNGDTAQTTQPKAIYLAELPPLPPLKDDEGDTKSKAGKSNAIQWLAANFQSSGSLSPSVNTRGALLTKGTLDYRLYSKVMANQPSPTTLVSPSGELFTLTDQKTYYIPMTFGLSLGIPLAERWTLQSGLQYTLLITTGEVATSSVSTTSPSIARGRIEQHYIGIPLTIAYDVVKNKNLVLYVIGGGTAEKGVAHVERLYTYNNSNVLVEIDHSTTAIAGFQFALNAGLGGSYRIYKFIDFYIEAGGAWYIPCNQPQSVRTEHPIGVFLKTGVRFSLPK